MQGSDSYLETLSKAPDRCGADGSSPGHLGSSDDNLDD